MRLVLITAVLTFVLDQVTKWVVVFWLDLQRLGEIDVIPPLVNFRMAWNYGVNFGLGASNSDTMRWILIAVALGITVFVLVWIWRADVGWWAKFAAGLLVGGALGNVVDRVLYGAVADFLNMTCCGFENPYSFNVADIAIFAGAIGLALFADGKKAA